MCSLTYAQVAIRQVGDMRDPPLQAVENVGGVDDRGAARLALLHEELQQVQTAHHIHVNCDLIQQQHLQRRRPSVKRQVMSPPLEQRCARKTRQ